MAKSAAMSLWGRSRAARRTIWMRSLYLGSVSWRKAWKVDGDAVLGRVDVGLVPAAVVGVERRDRRGHPPGHDSPVHPLELAAGQAGVLAPQAPADQVAGRAAQQPLGLAVD